MTLKSNNRLFYHFVAFVVVAIWGSTFVFTKMLLLNGLSPAQIFTLRFIIAYVLLLGYSLFTHHVYFLTENAAMLFTTATNTSLIVCSCPLFAMLLFAVVYRHSERINRIQAIGSVLACLGMAIVVLNGHFVLHLSPLGDILAFAACLCWAVYSLLMQPATEKYSTLFITRKVFFYGLLTIIPYYFFVPDFPSLDVIMRPEVLWNLLFLSVVASMLCYLLWNWVLSHLGVVVATNWVYFNPITTIIFAWWLLHEQITIYFLIGTVLILVGMYLADKKVVRKADQRHQQRL